MIRVRVTELVYQIGFTTLFRSQGREKNLATSSSSKQQAASSKQQAASSSKQATELISAYPHISISIDGTSPKLSWKIVLTMPYKHTKFQVESRQGAALVSKRKKIAKRSQKDCGKIAAKIAEKSQKNAEIAGKIAEKLRN